MMQIITINLPVVIVEAVNHICYDLGMFTSRSEFIRQAIANFLDDELEFAGEMKKLVEDE